MAVALHKAPLSWEDIRDLPESAGRTEIPPTESWSDRPSLRVTTRRLPPISRSRSCPLSATVNTARAKVQPLEGSKPSLPAAPVRRSGPAPSALSAHTRSLFGSPGSGPRAATADARSLFGRRRRMPSRHCVRGQAAKLDRHPDALRQSCRTLRFLQYHLVFSVLRGRTNIAASECNASLSFS